MKDLSITLLQNTTFQKSALELSAKNALENAVILSLFSDARVAESLEQRGYWGDSLTENQDLLGSELWLLDRVKLTDETLEMAGQYALDSLQWMKKERLINDLEVSAEFKAGELVLKIDLSLKDQTIYSFAVLASQGRATRWNG